MWNLWKEFFGKLTSFLLCARMLTHLRPNASYEKYIRLLAGIMGLALFLEPVRAVFGRAAEGDLVPEELFPEEVFALPSLREPEEARKVWESGQTGPDAGDARQENGDPADAGQECGDPTEVWPESGDSTDTAPESGEPPDAGTIGVIRVPAADPIRVELSERAGE